jgi:hypothetical protein
VTRIGHAIATVTCAGVAGATTPFATASAPIPTPIGVTKGYRLPAHGSLVAKARPVGDLFCSRSSPTRYGVHVELFARGLVLLLPAGIGIAPPLVRDGAYVVRGRCSYPLRTREPTGVIEVASGRTRTVGQLFDVWGQQLSRKRIAGFAAPPGRRVLAFVDGRRWRLDPRSIPLRRHAEIVLEVDGYVPPHTSYRFRKGL